MRMLMLAPALVAVTALAADLPVREVVLYKHGVGFFERSGVLGPGQSARLDFKTSEMNDVLKSLTIEEKGGGKISGLRYDASEPLSRKLGEFPFQLTGGQPLSSVLDQLKGERVELRFGSETVAGAIVSGRVIRGDEKRAESERLTLLLDSGELRNLDLSAAGSIRFTDPKLQEQFKDYLTTLAKSRSKETRSVYIDSTDAKGREILADYMIPMPVWKSSYRLIFDQSPQPTMEGWAIVDNTTGEDWTHIRLALVSGRPISFVSRLYEPRYVHRLAAELPEEQAQRPVVYDGAVEEEKTAAKQLPAGSGVAGAVAGYAPRRSMAAEAPSAFFDKIARRNEIASSVAVTASGREVGELFEYRIPYSVTVRQGESVMLPFLQQKVEARKLLIYTDGNSIHPMNAAEIINSTGKTLDGGPITVYDTGAYAGEALVETLKAGDKRLISYAVDLGTRITTQFDSKGELVREVHVRRGVMTARTAAVETRTYTIRNVDKKAKTLILEHPARPQYALLSPKPWEKTASAYRFEVKLAPGATEKIPVAEERVYDKSFSIANLTPDILFTYVRNKSLSDATRKQLERVAELKQQIADTDSQIHDTDSRISDLVQDQQRLRQNINSLNHVSGQQQLVQNYARQLAAQEGQIASLRDQISEMKKKRSALESDLNSTILKMEF